jgi:hypothetical protein
VPEAVSIISLDSTMVAKLSIALFTATGLEAPGLVERLIARVLSVCQGGSVLETGTLNAKVIVR